jgi:hypothetical protein
MAVGSGNDQRWLVDPDKLGEQLRLLFHFLRISPTYFLAHRLGPKRLTRGMPEQTKLAIQTYRRFGNVYDQDFEQWAEPHRRMSFNPTSCVQELVASPNEMLLPKEGYSLIEVKHGLSRAEALAMIEQVIRSSKHFCAAKASDTGKRVKTMWRALAVVYARARHPDRELWRIGAETAVIERAMGRVDPEEPKRLSAHAVLRRDLTQAVLRFAQVAILLSESAALGCFPNTEAPLITPSKQLTLAFENFEVERRFRTCGVEFDYVAERNMSYCKARTKELMALV